MTISTIASNPPSADRVNSLALAERLRDACATLDETELLPRVHGLRHSPLPPCVPTPFVYGAQTHPDVRERLLATDDALLFASGGADHNWGISIAAGDPQVARPASGNGANALSMALMQVREEEPRA